ncbi:unnamed protein product [Caenorhabditis bovis]|uniref:AMP-dependent synthetase/ligase domain-containing protein n=1 Tax=Caenorhabditis bovis TaxID=2654633 RepID=A0A8S1DZZ2_9PELO|nr:unnamed protein product [Caenorhabditis bovis]
MLPATLRRSIIHKCFRRAVASYIHCPTPDKFEYETLGQTLRESVEKSPSKDFCVFADAQIRKSYEQFYKDVRQMAASLFTLGLKKGDRVGVWGPNHYEWLVLQYAIASAGMIQVNVNPNYLADELGFVMRKTGMKAIFGPKTNRTMDYWHILLEVVPEMRRNQPGNGHIRSHILPELENVIMFGDDAKNLAGVWEFEKIFSAAGSNEITQLNEAERKIAPDDAVNIQFTSGTTGHPKGATLSHFVINNNARLVGIEMGLNKGDQRVCIPLPLYHIMGCATGVANVVNHAQTVVFPSRTYNVERIFQSVEAEKCTSLFGTPTVFIDLLKSPLLQKHDVSSLRGGFIAGAPCPYTLCQKMIEDLNMKDLVIGYGSTEIQFLTLTPLRIDPLERIKNVGLPMPHTELCVLGRDKNPVKRGEKGALYARAYSTMLSYWNDEHKTAVAVAENRWYKTGDIAIMNEDGSISIAGRNRDMIVKGGENVYPAEIEQFMFKLPYIADVQVVGVPDDRYGEQICGWVRLRDEFKNNGITPESIIDDCKKLMALYKVPRYILIKEEDDFPMTVTGKVKKNEIQKISKELLGLTNVKSHFNEV